MNFSIAKLEQNFARTEIDNDWLFILNVQNLADIVLLIRQAVKLLSFLTVLIQFIISRPTLGAHLLTLSYVIVVNALRQCRRFITG